MMISSVSRGKNIESDR